MSEHKDEEGGEKGAESKPKGKKKLIFIGLGVFALIAGAGVPMFLMGGEEVVEEVEHIAEELGEPQKRLENLDMGIFIVNLSETSSFLKTHIIIEYDAGLLEHQTMAIGGEGGGEGHGGGGAGGEGGGEGAEGGGTPHFLSKKETVLRHTIIRILSSKKVDEVLTIDGKDRLSEELVEGLNEALALEQPVVSQIFYTEFIIQ
jgi:flagellar basal body-associated protein FliL